MNASWVRRALFTLAPVEVLTVVLLLAGVAIPSWVRWGVATLIGITVATEALLWIRAYRRYRRGADRRQAASSATEHVIGDRLWSMVTAEFAMVASLVRWVMRRRAVPSGATAFTYHRTAAALMWTMVGLIAVEILVIHLALPSSTFRLVLFILSLYSLLWVVGFIAGFSVHPHLLTRDRLTLRHGPRVSMTIPLAQVATATVRDGDLPGIRSVRYEPASGPQGEHVLHMAHAGRTNLILSLREPLRSEALSTNEPITQVRGWADDAEALVSRLMC